MGKVDPTAVLGATGTGAATGATIGTAVFPVIGTGIGAGVGAVGGAIAGIFGGVLSKSEPEPAAEVAPSLLSAPGPLGISNGAWLGGGVLAYLLFKD